MKKIFLVVAVASLAVCAWAGLAPEPDDDTCSGGPPAAGKRVSLSPADLRWVDGPAALPVGAKLAVLEGDPKRPQLVTMRLRLPANYRVLPHKHLSEERVTVLEGSFSIGEGEVFSEKALQTLGPGAFSLMPAGKAHFAATKGEGVLLQITVLGPWRVDYLKPADDPRNAK